MPQSRDPLESSTPLKVLIVMPLAEQRGGAELALMHLLQAGQGLGVDWRIVFLEPGPMVQQARDLGIDVRIVSAGRLRQPVRTIKAIFRIRQMLVREKFDLVLSWMAKSHLYAAPAALMAGVPAVWFQHGIAARSSTIDRIASHLPAIGILACSSAAAVAQRALKADRVVRIVYPAVELERFDPAHMPAKEEIRAALALPANVPIVGIVGRLQRWKGMHVLIEAMPAILGQLPDARCVIVGGEHSLEPDYLPFLKKRISALHLEDRVLLVGLQKNIPEWMQAMDVVVHASSFEPFGIVILEAMALGKPTIAGAAGGPTEIITPEIDGQLVAFEDVSGLSAAILRYLEDPDWCRSVGAAARRRAAEFSTSRFAEKLVAAIRELLMHPRTAQSTC